MIFGARVGAVEFDGDVIRLAIAGPGGRLPQVHELHAAQVTYDTPETRHDAVIEALRSLVKKVKAKPAMYALVIPSHMCVARHVQVPFRGSRRVAAAVPIELEPYLALPIEDMLIDFNVTREIDGRTEALAFCLRLHAVEELLLLMKDAGVDPDCVTIDFAGLTALWQSHHRDVNGYDAVVHVGDTGSTLIAVRKKTILFGRVLPVGRNDVAATPAPLLREIQNTLRAFKAHFDIEEGVRSLYVTGCDLDEETTLAMQDRIGAPVVVENPLDGIKGLPKAFERAAAESSGAAASVAQFAPVIGAAFGIGSGLYGYDFRKGPLAKTGEARAMLLRGLFSVSLLLLIGVGYITYCVIDYQRNRARLDEVSREMWSIFLEAFPDSEHIAGRSPEQYGHWAETADFIQQEYGSMDADSDDAILAQYEKPTLLDILGELARVFPKGAVTFTNVRLQAGREAKFEITGDIADSAAYSAGIEALKASPVVTLDGEPVRQNKQGVQTFIMSLQR